MNEAGIKAAIAETSWLPFREFDTVTEIAGAPVVTMRVIIRVRTDVAANDLDALKTFLNQRTSAKNDAASLTVATPMVGGREQVGTWKNGGCFVRTETIPPNKEPTRNLYQILFQGTDSTLTYVSDRNCAALVETIEYFGLSTAPVLPAAGAGISYRMVSWAKDSESGAYKAVIEKRTRLEQIIAFSARVAADVIRTVTKVTGMSAAPSAEIVPAAGEVAERDLTRNEDCSVNKVDSREAITGQTNVQVEVRADRTVTRTTNTAVDTAELPDNPPVPADGQAKTLVIEYLPHRDRARTIEETQQGTKQEFPSEPSVTDVNGVSVQYVADNLTWAEVLARLAGVDPSRKAEWSVQHSPTFLNRYALSVKEHAVNAEASYGDAFTTGTATWTYSNKDGVLISVFVRFTTSLNIAETFLNNASASGQTIIGYDSGNRTGLNYLGRGRIAAQRLEKPSGS